MIQLAELLEWIQAYTSNHSILGPLVYVLVHILFAVFIIPCSPMAVIAGILWGKWLGLGISIISAFLASITTFGLSRFFLKQKIYNFLSKKFKKTDWFLEQTRKNGWKFVATVQLNPAAPGSTLGYLFGLTNINFYIYAFFLLVFMLPLQIILVIFGDVLPKIASGKISWILLLIMLSMIIYLFYGVKSAGKS